MDNKCSYLYKEWIYAYVFCIVIPVACAVDKSHLSVLSVCLEQKATERRPGPCSCWTEPAAAIHWLSAQQAQETSPLMESRQRERERPAHWGRTESERERETSTHTTTQQHTNNVHQNHTKLRYRLGEWNCHNNPEYLGLMSHYAKIKIQIIFSIKT